MAITKSNLGIDNTFKRKRVSKKSKRSWRKHSDIKNIEEYLEVSRFEERTGGPASEKEDSLLFFIDSKDASSNDLNKVIDKKSSLKCHSSLVNNELILPRATRLTSNKKIEKIDNKFDAKYHKIMKKKNNNKLDKSLNPVYDIWGTPDLIFEDVHNAKVTRKMPVKVPRHHAIKPSGLPSVPLPHPGMSYNPLFEDHQDLLATAAEVEIKKDKLELKIFRATDAQFPTADEAPDQLSWLKEMSEGLPGADISLYHQKLSDKKVEKMDTTVRDHSDEDLSGDARDGGEVIKNKPVWRGDKKTEKQRRKQKIEKEKKLEKQREKAERIKRDEKSRIKSIKRSIREREMKIAAKKVWRQLDREKRRDETKKLGRGKFVEPNIPLKMADELEGTLRLLKPEGHILEDVLRNFQRRNMLAARSHQKP